MSATSFTSADVKTRKAWSERTFLDITTDTEITSDAMSAGILKQETDLSKNSGDQVKIHFLSRLTNKGFIGDAAATGSEKVVTYYQDTILVDELRQVVQIPNKGTISAQRVTFNLPEDTYRVLKAWMQERMTVGTLNQLAGNDATSYTYDGEVYSSAATLLEITGLNTITAASTNQIIYAGSGNTTDALVNADTTAVFGLSYIDECEARARKNRPYIKPLEGKGNIKYRCYLHVDGFKQLVENNSDNIQFRDIYFNMMAGGKKDATFEAAFQYSQTEVVVTDKIPYGVDSNTSQTNTRRAVFCGQEAGAIAFGKGYQAGGKATAGFKFEEDFIDVNKWKRISICGLFGISKAQYNSVDRGTIVITHYVA